MTEPLHSARELSSCCERQRCQRNHHGRLVQPCPVRPAQPHLLLTSSTARVHLCTGLQLTSEDLCSQDERRKQQRAVKRGREHSHGLGKHLEPETGPCPRPPVIRTLLISPSRSTAHPGAQHSRGHSQLVVKLLSTCFPVSAGSQENI